MRQAFVLLSRIFIVLTLIVAMGVVGPSSSAAVVSEKIGPGSAICDNSTKTCKIIFPVYLVLGYILINHDYVEFYYDLLPDQMRENFVGQCFNGGCSVTLYGNRPDPKGKLVTPTDIQWRPEGGE